MSSFWNRRFAWLLAVNVLGWCVLSLQQSLQAAPRQNNEPFANAVEQRQEMIEQLREANAQLQEQLVLLKSGRLRVVLSEATEP